MTLHLILTRHAKSSWDDPALDDLDRPLNRRGQRAALLLGKALSARGYHPAEVLCSTARRAAETWATLAGCLPAPEDVRFEPSLYRAQPDELRKAMRGGARSALMIIAHNPGLSSFAGELLASPPALPALRRFPAGAAAVIAFEGARWQDISPGTGSLLDFFQPGAGAD